MRIITFFFVMLMCNYAYGCNYEDLKNTISELLQQNIKKKLIVNFKIEQNLPGECKEFKIVQITQNKFIMEFENNNNNKYTINGNYSTLFTIPTFNHNIKAGHVITEEDLHDFDINERLVNNSVITDKAKLIGMEAKKFIKANTPIAGYDIKSPLLVKRNDIITLIYNANNILLKTKAMALSAGAEGDKIKFRNLQSKKEILATVVSNEEAIVE